MILKTFRIMPGNAQIYTNMYVIADEESKEGILIDAAGGIDKIYNYHELIANAKDEEGRS